MGYFNNSLNPSSFTGGKYVCAVLIQFRIDENAFLNALKITQIQLNLT